VLGLLAGWFGIPHDAILRGMKKKFESRSPELLEANDRALSAGIAFARSHALQSTRTLQQPNSAPGSKMLCDGNEMCAAAALFAGVEFFGGYPITPSTEVMQILARELWKYGGAVLQAEDEIAGIGAAVGASFAGRKSMTASSGPGISLKTEIMGLATIAELPLVIYNVQRGGPSTGLPTKPEQADLFQAAFSSHGDVLRPVLAPTTVADTFRIIVDAFNIAEEFQTPVLVLSDQEIAQRKETVDPIDTTAFTIVNRKLPSAEDLADYARFKLTDDGISPLSYPGLERGNYLCAGIEHNERGEPTSSGAMHTRMNEKRFRKLAPLASRSELFEAHGDARAPIGLISWGGSAGVCREAFERARSEGLPVKLLIPYLVYPVAETLYDEFFASVQAGLLVELSFQAQLYRVLRMFVDVPKGFRPLSRSGANPFRPDEVLTRLRSLAANLSPQVEVMS
jgi:2-oxoglutarate ferredoxin oxidoreductase subunit alpha